LYKSWLDWKVRRVEKSISQIHYHRHSEMDKNEHPAGRVGKPEDIASLVLYLISDNSSFITGANFIVDGGMTRKMIYV